MLQTNIQEFEKSFGILFHGGDVIWIAITFADQ